MERLFIVARPQVLMNEFQQVWWEQAKSDFAVFEKMRGDGTSSCHVLHYFQMSTEKLGKAFLWRTGSPPPARHVGFAQLMQGLGQVRGPKNRKRVANLFDFGRYGEFQSWITSVMPIVHEVHKLAPACANDGPNPEYPWPHKAPTNSPVNHDFQVWHQLTTGPGRGLMRFVSRAITVFPEIASP